MQRKKEIEFLRTRLASLEAEQKREEQEQEALLQCHQQLLNSLEQTQLSFEAFVRCFSKDIRKVLGKIEREQTKPAGVRPRTAAVKKKTTKKKARRRSVPGRTVKIFAGRNGNLPEEQKEVYQVKDKGARPKALKAYAEKVGLENFLNQCLLDRS